MIKPVPEGTRRKLTMINRGRSDCKGNAWTEERDGLLITTCDKCSLHWTMPKRATI